MSVFKDFKVLNYTNKCVVALGMYEIYLCLTDTDKGFPGQLLNGQSETSIMGALFVT